MDTPVFFAQIVPINRSISIEENDVYAIGPHELQTHGVEAPTFKELAGKALTDLSGLRNLGIVCGPITTGGTGHQILNFEIFNATIHGLVNLRGQKLFDQTPYEFGLRRLAMKWEEAGGTGYCMPIMDEFYYPLFESNAIVRGFFIPGWQSSIGAKCERKKFLALGHEIRDLTHADIREFMLEKHPVEHVDHVMSLLAG